MSIEMTTGLAIERRIVDHEHRELVHCVNHVEETAHLVGSLSVHDLVRALDQLMANLRTGVLAHDDWEDAWLYPRLDQLAGSPWATRLMRFEHGQIAHLIGRLDEATRRLHEGAAPVHLEEVRGLLWSIHAIVRHHLEREEHFLIPLLDVAGADA
jgi:hemerythrin-like domain-containing protein